MRFTLNGKRFELTAVDVRRRLRGVEPEPVHQLGVRIDGRLYPVKQAFEAATGIERSAFVSHTACRHLSTLGFELVGESKGGTRQFRAAGKLSVPASSHAVPEATGGWASLGPGGEFADRYRIEELLGEGDRKRTYLAWDTKLKRRVALALIKPEAALADPSGTRREAETFGQTEGHDNIVTLYEEGIADGVEYLVFEYLAGGTLRDYLRSRQESPLSIDEVMRFGRQLARALSHVHQRGLIHRDVAPANVWLDERNVAHLGDFDSAVRRDAQDGVEALPLTTEAYASPEEAAGEQLDDRSDLYSLGAVLYEAATGQRPDAGLRGFVAPRVLRPDIPAALNALICKLLSLSPDNRPASADEVLEALKLRPSPPRAPDGDRPWTETLPFPLASILWQYQAEIDAQSKAEHLLNFFEALAQFIVTVQLSAYKTAPEFFEANRPSWFGADPNNPHRVDFRVASFGMWVNLHQRLAKTARRMLSGEPTSADRRCDLFAAKDRSLVIGIAGRDLAAILDAACQERNDWKHAGVAGPDEHVRRLRELEELLARTQTQLADSFKVWDLLRPGVASYTEGTYEYTVTALTGTNPAFRKKRVRVRHPLDSGRLYLLERGSHRALQLVPLIRVMRGPKIGEEACYFYNRIQKDGRVRWISYHFHGEPDISCEDELVVQFISELQRRL
jgi:serine/threonine protein kinase